MFLDVQVYLGVPSMTISCASTLQIRYRGHNSDRRPQDEELDKIQNTSRTNANCQLDKYKIPAGQIQNANNRELNWLSQAPAYESPEVSIVTEGEKSLKCTEKNINPGWFLGAVKEDGIREILWQRKSENLTTCRRLWPMPCQAPTFSQEKLCLSLDSTSVKTWLFFETRRMYYKRMDWISWGVITK